MLARVSIHVLEPHEVLGGIIFDVEKFSTSYWHLLPRYYLPNMTTQLSASSLTLYLDDNTKRKSSISLPRMHHLSSSLDFRRLEQAVTGEESLPGKHPTILIEGYFKSVLSSQSELDLVEGRGEGLRLSFESQEVVTGLIAKHGDSSKTTVFQIVEKEGVYYLKGVNPYVLEHELVNGKSGIRRNFYEALIESEDSRAASLVEVEDARRSSGDVVGLLKKASASSSLNSSLSKKAAIGLHSIDGSIFFDTKNTRHTTMLKEMERNSLILDKTRFAILSFSVLERVITLFYQSGVSGGVVGLKGTCAGRDSTQKVRFAYSNLLAQTPNHDCFREHIVFRATGRSDAAGSR